MTENSQDPQNTPFEPDMPFFLTPANYWDVAAALDRKGYTDWEGFANGPKIKERVMKILTEGKRYPYWNEDPEVQNKVQMVIDLVLHWAYENADQAGYTVRKYEVQAAYDVLVYVFIESSRFMSKSVRPDDKEESE